MDEYVTLKEGLSIEHLYGSVRWEGPLRMRSKLKLDEIVQFRRLEINVYPDENEKPPIGEELNKDAEVILHDVWPFDKMKKMKIKDPHYLQKIDWANQLRDKITSMGAKFVGYCVTSGDVTFAVNHFSKYGLNDTDEEEDVQMDPDLSRREAELQLQVQRKKTSQIVIDEDMPVMATPKRIRELGLQTPGFAAPVSFGSIREFKTTPAFSITPMRSFKRRPAYALTFNDKDPLFDASPSTTQREKIVESVAHRQVLSRRFDFENQHADRDFDTKANDYEEFPKAKRARDDAFEAESDDVFNTKKPHEMETIDSLPQIGLLSSQYTTRPLDGGPIDVVASKGVCAPIGMIAKSGGLMTLVKPLSCKVAVVPLDFPDDLETDFLEESIEKNAKFSKSTIQRNEDIILDDESNTRTRHVQPSGDFAGLINSYIHLHDLYNKKFQARLWTLCELLFKKNETSLEEWHKVRAQKMGLWIQNVLKDEDAKGLWEYIALGKFHELPFTELNYFVLSATLPLCHDINVRSKAQKQIYHWLNNGQLGMISEGELKAYMLVAGMRKLNWKQANGKDSFINIYSGLHWLQALGLHVWYLGDEDEPISRSIDRLIADAEDQLLMLPMQDPAWELIRFAGAEHHRPIEPCLEAAQFCTSWVSDFYPSWHMWAVIQTAGNWKMHPAAEEKLHRRYAAQLVSCGALHLAVFVLSHIEDEINRESAIQALLISEVASLNDALIEKILKFVKLPDRLIFTALALDAKSKFQADKEFQYHVRAKNWSDAEKLYVNQLALEAILSSNHKELSSLTAQLTSDLSANHKWSSKTLLFAEYSYLRTIVTANGETSNPELIRLCNSIDERLDTEENVKVAFKDSFSTIAVYVASLRAKVGTPSWMQGKAAGKRYQRHGFTLTDMTIISRLLKNQENR